MGVCNFTTNWNNWDIRFFFVLEIMSKLEMCRYGQLVIKFFNIILNIQQDISFRVWAHNHFYGPQLIFITENLQIEDKDAFLQDMPAKSRQGSDYLWALRSQVIFLSFLLL